MHCATLLLISLASIYILYAILRTYRDLQDASKKEPNLSIEYYEYESYDFRPYESANGSDNARF